MHNGEGGVLYGGIRLEQPPLYTRPTIGIFIILKPCTVPAVGASPLQNTPHFSEESRENRERARKFEILNFCVKGRHKVDSGRKT